MANDTQETPRDRLNALREKYAENQTPRERLEALREKHRQRNQSNAFPIDPSAAAFGRAFADVEDRPGYDEIRRFGEIAQSEPAPAEAGIPGAIENALRMAMGAVAYPIEAAARMGEAAATGPGLGELPAAATEEAVGLGNFIGQNLGDLVLGVSPTSTPQQRRGAQERIYSTGGLGPLLAAGGLRAIPSQVAGVGGLLRTGVRGIDAATSGLRTKTVGSEPGAIRQFRLEDVKTTKTHVPDKSQGLPVKKVEKTKGVFTDVVDGVIEKIKTTPDGMLRTEALEVLGNTEANRNRILDATTEELQYIVSGGRLGVRSSPGLKRQRPTGGVDRVAQERVRRINQSVENIRIEPKIDIKSPTLEPESVPKQKPPVRDSYLQGVRAAQKPQSKAVVEPKAEAVPETPLAGKATGAKPGTPKAAKLTQKPVPGKIAEGATITVNTDPIVQLQGGLGAVRGAFSPVIGMLPERVRSFAKEAIDRGKHPEYKRLMRMIEKVADPLRARLEAGALETVRKAGFRAGNRAAEAIKSKLGIESSKLSNREMASDLADRLEGKLPPTPVSRAVAAEFKRMHDQAVASGLDIGEVTTGYFRRQLKDDIAQVIYDDLAPLHAKLKEAGVDPKALEREYQARLRAGDISSKTEAALAHLIKKEQVKNIADAIRLTRREVGKTLFAEAGWEKARTVEWPAEFYERNAGRVFAGYVRSWAKRMAETKVFGKDGGVAELLLERIAEGSIEEAKFARQVLDAWTGNIEITKPIPPWLRKWSERYMAFGAITKIGFGFATLKNVFQTAISTAVSAGWGRTIRGTYRVITSPAHRELIRRAGPLNHLSLEAMAGYVPSSKSGRVAKATLGAVGFNRANIMNQYVAASTAVDFIPELHKIANGKTKLGPSRIKWAQDKLETMGVDYKKPLTSDALSTGVYRFATDTQLQKNVVRDPLSRNDPRLRPLWFLKGFGIRQFHFQKNLQKFEIQHGNLFPLVRLAVGGAVSGYLEQEIERIVRSWINGESPKVSDKPFIEQALDWMAAIGAWSMMTDVVSAENKLRSVVFATNPVVISEFGKGIDVLGSVWEEMDMNAIFSMDTPIPERPPGEIAQRLIKPTAQFGGTFMREAAKRVETESQTEGREDYFRGEAKDRIFKAALRSDTAGAQRVFRVWNENYPHRKFKYQDLSPKAYGEWLEKRGREDERKSPYNISKGK